LMCARNNTDSLEEAYKEFDNMVEFINKVSQ